jgi:hypothetical protein
MVDVVCTDMMLIATPSTPSSKCEVIFCAQLFRNEIKPAWNIDNTSHVQTSFKLEGVPIPPDTLSKT